MASASRNRSGFLERQELVDPRLDVARPRRVLLERIRQFAEFDVAEARIPQAVQRLADVVLAPADEVEEERERPLAAVVVRRPVPEISDFVGVVGASSTK